MVGVLVLINQDIPESVLILIEDSRERSEQLNGHHQQIVEVHGRRLQQPLLVEPIDVGDLLVIGPTPLLGERFEVDELVLGVTDCRSYPLRGESLRIEVEITKAVLDETTGIYVVVDRERVAVTEHRGVLPKNPHASAVERRDPHPAGNPTDEPSNALFHLVGGLVRKGDGQDAVGGHPQFANEVGDPICEHSGLARTRSGHNEQWAFRRRNRLALRGVEVVE